MSAVAKRVGFEEFADLIRTNFSDESGIAAHSGNSVDGIGSTTACDHRFAGGRKLLLNADALLESDVIHAAFGEAEMLNILVVDLKEDVRKGIAETEYLFHRRKNGIEKYMQS